MNGNYNGYKHGEESLITVGQVALIGIIFTGIKLYALYFAVIRILPWLVGVVFGGSLVTISSSNFGVFFALGIVSFMLSKVIIGAVFFVIFLIGSAIYFAGKSS